MLIAVQKIDGRIQVVLSVNRRAVLEGEEGKAGKLIMPLLDRKGNKGGTERSLN